MNLFQNSNSNTWRGQQDLQDDPRPDSKNTHTTPHPANTVPQDNFRANDQNRNDTGTQNSSSGQNWMNNPALAGIDPSRLQMLSSLASQAQNKSQNELLPFLMAAASQKNTNGMSFRPDEIETIISVMKVGKSPQEVQQIDRICTLMRQFGTIRGLNQRR